MAPVMDMKKRWRTPFCLVLCCGALWFLADAAHCRAAVEEALSLCARSVIPSLFPFLVISSLLLAMGFGDLTASVLSGLMEPLFRIGGPGSAALVLGLLGGYPIGAKTAGELYQSHALSRQEAERLLTFCNNCSPVFLISVLGSGIFGSVRAGVWLLLIHVGSALLVERPPPVPRICQGHVLFRPSPRYRPLCPQWTVLYAAYCPSAPL